MGGCWHQWFRLGTQGSLLLLLLLFTSITGFLMHRFAIISLLLSFSLPWGIHCLFTRDFPYTALVKPWSWLPPCVFPPLCMLSSLCNFFGSVLIYTAMCGILISNRLTPSSNS